MPKNEQFFSKQFPLMTVHTKIDYYNSAKFTNEYRVYSRVAFIKNSSIGFENIVTFRSQNKIAQCEGILVYVDSKSGKVERLPDFLRSLVKQYEGENCKFLD
jgi:acyl-CoA thioesterase FadM